MRRHTESHHRKVGAERFPAPIRLEDAAWVSYRLAEVLPIETAEKQALLELEDAGARFVRLNRFLTAQGLVLRHGATGRS